MIISACGRALPKYRSSVDTWPIASTLGGGTRDFTVGLIENETE